MVPIEQESNPEVLRQYAILMRDQYCELYRKLNQLEEKLLHQPQQPFLDSKLRDQLSRLRAKFFGFGREELGPKKPRPVSHEQEQLKLHGKRFHQEKPPDEKTVISKETEKRSALQKMVHDMSKEELKAESRSRELEMTTENQTEDQAWEKIEGLAQESVEITITERTYKKVVHSQSKYRLKPEYNKTGKEVIITAAGPAKLKPGCQYSIDFAVAVACDKYEIHLPLERQRKQMEMAGLDVGVKTLFNLCQSVAEHCDASVVPKIRRDIFSDFCAVHADETPWKLLKSKTHGEMCVISNRVGSYFRFEPTRSGKVAAELFDGYEGAVLADGFSGYNVIKKTEGLRLGHCWAHARREFYERTEDFEKEATEACAMIDELFAIEAKAATFDELRALRRTESKAAITRFYHWCLETKMRFMPGEGIVSAINYCFNHWRGLTLFLEDLSLPLSNNDAERALRHSVVGRKNYAGSQTIDGADVAATLFTVIESSKKVGLEPREYLKYVITERWHNRDPKSPAEISAERFGKNNEIIFPEKNQWRV